MSLTTAENPFSGVLAEEYDFLRLMCPNSALLASKIGHKIQIFVASTDNIEGLEIGCGTGISTYELIHQNTNIQLIAVDSSAQMLDQARANFKTQPSAERVKFIEDDALAALKKLPNNSMAFVTSNYAIHNFEKHYRTKALTEIFRVLKAGGIFINGDRYAISDPSEHLKDTQNTVRKWFKLFQEIKRLDLLEEWIIHLLSDESPEIIMGLDDALIELKNLGFVDIGVDFRDGVDTLLHAYKPVE